MQTFDIGDLANLKMREPGPGAFVPFDPVVPPSSTLDLLIGSAPLRPENVGRMVRRWWSAPEIAELTGLSAYLIRGDIKSGLLPSARAGHGASRAHRRVHVEALISWARRMGLRLDLSRM